MKSREEKSHFLPSRNVCTSGAANTEQLKSYIGNARTLNQITWEGIYCFLIYLFLKFVYLVLKNYNVVHRVHFYHRNWVWASWAESYFNIPNPSRWYHLL